MIIIEIEYVNQNVLLSLYMFVDFQILSNQFCETETVSRTS